ncbi:MAG: ubiquinol-cytochrome c reductase iron-sulfur subunit, partial [Pseudomonadota bacterium]
TSTVARAWTLASGFIWSTNGQAAKATVEVDLSPIQVGQSITVMWRGKPVFIRHRTEDEIAEARAVPIEELPDPIARNDNTGEVPATDENRATRAEFLIQVGICTHLGCVPLGEAGDFDGWFCPCHGSHYDTSGRIRRGPAPENLPIPVYQYSDDTTVVIG